MGDVGLSREIEVVAVFVRERKGLSGSKSIGSLLTGLESIAARRVMPNGMGPTEGVGLPYSPPPVNW